VEMLAIFEKHTVAPELVNVYNPLFVAEFTIYKNKTDKFHEMPMPLEQAYEKSTHLPTVVRSLLGQAAAVANVESFWSGMGTLRRTKIAFIT